MPRTKLFTNLPEADTAPVCEVAPAATSVASFAARARVSSEIPIASPVRTVQGIIAPEKNAP